MANTDDYVIVGFIDPDNARGIDRINSVTSIFDSNVKFERMSNPTMCGGPRRSCFEMYGLTVKGGLPPADMIDLFYKTEFEHPETVALLIDSDNYPDFEGVYPRVREV